MKNKIKNLEPQEAKIILTEFLDIYFDKGFGLMNKTEIETLLYFVLKKYGLLEGKCFNDSYKLQITEARARKLIYESQIKYDRRNQSDLDLHLRKYIGECLSHAIFVKNKKEISFVIEDKYIRQALNAKLRDNNFFADTSFNKDIVTINETVFHKMVTLLVPNYQQDDIVNKLNAFKIDEKKDKDKFIKLFIEKTIAETSTHALSLLGSLITNG